MAGRSSKVIALLLAGALGATVAISLSACAQPEPEPNREAAACSQTVYLGTRSELREWWTGNSLPVTWKSSVTKNSDWDGYTRPDHEPPHGYQGLEQTVESGTHYQPLEYSAICSYPPLEGGGGFAAGNRKTMDLTPTVTIDGQTFDLSRIEFANADLGEPRPYYTVGGKQVYYRCGEVQTFSQKTPRGYLYYNVTWECPQGKYGVVVLGNYSR